MERMWLEAKPQAPATRVRTPKPSDSELLSILNNPIFYNDRLGEVLNQANIGVLDLLRLGVIEGMVNEILQFWLLN